MLRRPRWSPPLGGLAVAGSGDLITLAFAQANLCGVFFVLFSVFKLGFLANFSSKPILVGFVGGLALDILVSHVAKMLGVSIDSGAEFVEKLTGLVTGLTTTNLWATLITSGVIAAPRRRPAADGSLGSCRGLSPSWCSPRSSTWSPASSSVVRRSSERSRPGHRR